MKTFAPFLVLCTTLAGSASALAASSTDVSVTGLITPAACTPSLSGAGSFDFGKIAAQDLNQDTLTSFVSGLQRFTIACSTPTRFAIDGVDNRSGTAYAPNSDFFGVGLNGAVKLGAYRLRLQAAGMTGDGRPDVTFMMSSNGGSSWTVRNGSAISLYNREHAPVLVGFGFQGASEPSPMSTLSADVQATMFIQKASDLTLTDEVSIDGSASIQVTYL